MKTSIRDTGALRNEHPLVSIGMPVYNGAAWMRESIECVLGQTYDNIELIISDNASTDESRAIAEEYAASDKRVRCYANAGNVGAADNYNLLVDRARGRYFKWAACDDLMSSDFIEQCVAALQADNSASLAYAYTTIIGTDSKPLSEYQEPLRADATSPVDRWRNCMASIGECNAVFGVIRVEVLRHSALIGKFIGSDKHLLTELSLYGRFVCIPQRLFLRRDHPAASSRDKTTSGQLRFFDPRLKGRVLSRWRGLRYDMRALRRAPLTPGDKLRALYSLLRSLVWQRQKFLRELTGSFGA